MMTMIPSRPGPERVPQIELGAEPLPKSGASQVLKRELRAPHYEGPTERCAGA
jgi:hypothetical protein